MIIPKSEIQIILDNMPDDCDVEDLQTRLYLLEKIKRGQESVELGQTITHEEVKERISKKWSKN